MYANKLFCQKYTFNYVGPQKDIRKKQNLFDVNGNSFGLTPKSAFGLCLTILAFGGMVLLLLNEIGTNKYELYL